jgi:hypothetical protein
MGFFEGGLGDMFKGEMAEPPKPADRAGREDPGLAPEEYENVDPEQEIKRIEKRISELEKAVAEDIGDVDADRELSDLKEKLYNLQNPIGQDY